MKYGDKKEDNGRAIAVDAKTQFYMDHDPNFMMYVSLFLDKPSGVRVVGTLDNTMNSFLLSLKTSQSAGSKHPYQHYQNIAFECVFRHNA